jgi:hypothetical protein
VCLEVKVCLDLNANSIDQLLMVIQVVYPLLKFFNVVMVHQSLGCICFLNLLETPIYFPQLFHVLCIAQNDFDPMDSIIQ